jgi:acetyltransferase
MPVGIRALASHELKLCTPALSDLLIDAVANGASLGFLAPLSEEHARSYWLSLRRELLASTRLLLVAQVGDRIVGSGQLALPSWPNARHRAELQKLFVSTDLRGRGVGKLLVTALHDAARRRGRSLILLGARRGAPAEQFYRSLGYREVGVVPGFATGPAGERYDNVSFYKELECADPAASRHARTQYRLDG